MFGIETQYGNHHAGFTEFANKPQNHKLARTVGKALAMTMVDALTDPDMVPAAKAEWQAGDGASGLATGAI